MAPTKSTMTSASVPPTNDGSGTFWTKCNGCRAKFEFLRRFLNVFLECRSCGKKFKAIETTVPSRDSGPIIPFGPRNPSTPVAPTGSPPSTVEKAKIAAGCPLSKGRKTDTNKKLRETGDENVKMKRPRKEAQEAVQKNKKNKTTSVAIKGSSESASGSKDGDTIAENGKGFCRIPDMTTSRIGLLPDETQNILVKKAIDEIEMILQNSSLDGIGEEGNF